MGHGTRDHASRRTNRNGLTPPARTKLFLTGHVRHVPTPPARTKLFLTGLRLVVVVMVVMVVMVLMCEKQIPALPVKTICESLCFFFSDALLVMDFWAPRT